MDKSQNQFKKQVLKALCKGIISKEEAKECLKRGFESQELPIFFDSSDKETTTLKNYVLGLEKLGFPTPFIVLDGDLQE